MYKQTPCKNWILSTFIRPIFE